MAERRTIYGAAAITLFAGMLLPTFAFWVLFLGTDRFEGYEPAWTIALGKIVSNFGGLPAEFAQTAAVVIPAFLTAIALRPNEKSISQPQIVAITILLIALVSSALVVTFFPPPHSSYNITNGAIVVAKLYSASAVIMKSSLTYILFIFGLTASAMETRNGNA